MDAAPGALPRVGDHSARGFRWGPPHIPVRASALLIAAIISSLVLAVIGYGVRREREIQMQAGRTTAERLAQILAEQTGRTFQAAGLALLGVQDLNRLAAISPMSESEVRAVLRQRLAEVPNIRALVMVGPDGHVRHDTTAAGTSPGSIADRGYFLDHQRSPSQHLAIGAPVISRQTGTWFVPVTRRLERPDGGFDGVAVAVVEPGYYADFFRNLGLSPNDTVALWNQDGTLITRVPSHDLIGQKMTPLNMTHRSDTLQGGAFGSEALDGQHRIMSYQAVDHLPLVVSVGLSESDLLASWRRTALGATAIGLLSVGLIFALTMVLEVRRHDRRLNRQQRFMMRKLEALGQMTGSIAHDFRNMLAVVSSTLSLVRRSGANEELQVAVQTAEQAIARGANLLTQLLAFARQQELELRPADINALIAQLEPILRQAAGPGVRLGIVLHRPLPACRLDTTQFDAALVNLVVNGRDAMPDGGQITIRTHDVTIAKRRRGGLEPGRYVRVSVEDTGVGIAPEALSRVFEPYFTTKGGTGTGLGLSQVHGFMHQIGGAVRIRSTSPAGTTFDLLFPIAARNLS